jgi:hypothetical protein
VCGACGNKPSARDGEFNMTWTLNPAPAVVGPATLLVHFTHKTNGQVTGASVRLEGFMSHAGMAPVLATATERTPGAYEIPFTFTMQGDWVLLVRGELPGGHRVEQRIDVANVRPSG